MIQSNDLIIPGVITIANILMKAFDDKKNKYLYYMGMFALLLCIQVLSHSKLFAEDMMANKSYLLLDERGKAYSASLQEVRETDINYY